MLHASHAASCFLLYHAASCFSLHQWWAFLTPPSMSGEFEVITKHAKGDLAYKQRVLVGVTGDIGGPIHIIKHARARRVWGDSLG